MTSKAPEMIPVLGGERFLPFSDISAVVSFCGRFFFGNNQERVYPVVKLPLPGTAKIKYKNTPRTAPDWPNDRRTRFRKQTERVYPMRGTNVPKYPLLVAIVPGAG